MKADTRSDYQKWCDIIMKRPHQDEEEIMDDDRNSGRRGDTTPPSMTKHQAMMFDHVKPQPPTKLSGLDTALIDSVVFLLREYQTAHRLEAGRLSGTARLHQFAMVDDAQGLVSRIAEEFIKVHDEEMGR